jgi:hypothetical protein
LSNTVKVTSKGREVIAGRMIGSTPTQAEPLNVGWGTGGVGTGSPYTAALTDVAAFREGAESRTAGSSSKVTTTTANDTYQVTGTIVSLSGQTIAEALLSDSATQPFATTVAAGGGTVIGSNSNTSMNTAASYTPANNTYVQVDTEVMKVTAGTGTTSLTVTRAQNGSSAISTIAAADVVTMGNPPGVATANGTLFVHATFSGLPLNTSDSIAFTFQVAFSSS